MDHSGLPRRRRHVAGALGALRPVHLVQQLVPRTYGTLAGGIILLLWLNYTAWAILFGGELNAELDRQADIRAAGGPKAGLIKPAKRTT